MAVKDLVPSRWVVLLIALAAGVAQGQSLPATMPTTNAAASPGKTTERPSHRADVAYTDGQLQVTAANSSLNQILREISKQTGMKISGGVREERVYGKFGPSAPALVLASLLEGTGSNMFLRENAAEGPVELVLTPRNGEPTPPPPESVVVVDDTPVAPPARPIPAPSVSNAAPQLPFSKPVPTPAITSTEQTPVTPPPGGIVDAPTVAPATEPGTTPGPATQTTGTSDSASPNGVLTPEGIAQQLLQLQQQQQAQPPAGH